MDVRDRTHADVTHLCAMDVGGLSHIHVPSGMGKGSEERLWDTKNRGELGRREKRAPDNPMCQRMVVGFPPPSKRSTTQTQNKTSDLID